MSEQNYVVDVQWAVKPSHAPSESDLAGWVETVLSEHRERAELTVRIVDETEITSLNKQYRHKNSATNVLSFPFDEDIPLEIPLLGDLLVCATVVEQEAAEQGKPLMAHWAHMIIHGTLHLLGYDHIADNDALIMEQKEIQYLQQLGFTNPYEVTAHS